ncbi:MAG: hypothetical protein J5614_09010 [Paludibacteraceae bacterium]|nr:hypothetical protein [Paludibacteraceae bacterium]
MSKDLGYDPSTLPGRRGLDLTGIPFGKLTPLYPIKGKSAPDGSRMWMCSCECNPAVRCEVSTHLLRNGHVRSCGCLVDDTFTSNLVGRKFGRLTVLSRDPNRSGKDRVLWLCECSCENKTRVSVPTYRLTTGVTRSCGCLQEETRVLANTKYSSDVERKLRAKFNDMKMRCYNKNRPSYERYGAKGVTICDEWLDDPMKFIRWSLDHGYHEGLSIDRFPDRHGPYAPWNCRYVGDIQQAENKDSTTMLTVLGIEKSVHAWNSFLGHAEGTLRSMLLSKGKEAVIEHIASKLTTAAVGTSGDSSIPDGLIPAYAL